MLIAIRKNKAHQTVEAMGCADNALEAALSVLCQEYLQARTLSDSVTLTLHSEFCDQYARARARGVIIAKNFNFVNINSHNLSSTGVDGGYNGGSKNHSSTQRLYRCFFVPLIIVACRLTRCAFFYGGVGQEQSPRCLWQLEHPHLYTVASNLKTTGGFNA